MSKIEFKSVTKSFAGQNVLNDISFKIEENKIYGLLGRNGAGKTTLLNCLSHKLFPSQGEVLINEVNTCQNDQMLRRVFYMMADDYYPEHYTLREIFKWIGQFYPSLDMEYASTLFDAFKIGANLRYRNLSTGYKTIVKNIAALASNAEILLFDEPLLGLDAAHRDLFYKELLAYYINHPKMMILSTHIVLEIQDLIEDVLILKDGKLICQDSTDHLLHSCLMLSGDKKKMDAFLKGRPVIGADVIGNQKTVTVWEHTIDKTRLDQYKLEVSYPGLQDLLIQMTK